MASESDSELIRGASEREHVRVVALVQARMGSIRLPGKVLEPVGGQPVLWHLVHRLKACRLLEDIAVATSSTAADDAIVEWCTAEGVTVVRGPENDMLAAQARAAEKLDADIIVQASCDAPFIDAGLVDHMVATLIEQDGDYVLPADQDRDAQEGVEAFSRRALDRLMMDAAQDPAARASVTGYFRLHPEFVRVVQAQPYGLETNRSAVDAHGGLGFVEAVHARLSPKAGTASLADLLLLLEREPELKALPSPASLLPAPVPGARAPLALIRCDGGGKFGYGHVKRMIALARALRDQQGIGAIFALHGSEDAGQPIRRAGFEVTRLEQAFQLENLIRANKPDLLILDGREGPSRGELEELKRLARVTAVIDDGHERRLASDFAYYPPVPGAMALDWHGSHSMVRVGWEWALLGLNPNQVRKRAPGSRPTVLVAMGGSDPHGLTLRMGKALTVLDTAYRVRFIVGTGTKDPGAVARGLVALKKNYETVEGADDLSVEYANADVAICAFGVTAYELAACGIPAIYLGLTQDHVLSASAFADAGMGLNLGLAEKVSDADIARFLQWLLNKPAARRDMRKQGMALLDGQGAARIAADLASALAEARAPVKQAL